MADGQLLEAMERDDSREVERPTPPFLVLGFNQNWTLSLADDMSFLHSMSIS